MIHADFFTHVNLIVLSAFKSKRNPLALKSKEDPKQKESPCSRSLRREKKMKSHINEGDYCPVS